MGLVSFYIKGNLESDKIFSVTCFLYLSGWSLTENRMSVLAIFLSIRTITLVGAALAISNTGGPVITLSYGSFQGNATGDLVEFLGMPYAAPPYVSSVSASDDIFLDKYFLESLRFAPATLPLKFAGVRQATSFGAACPQQATAVPGGSANFSTLLSSEDCRSPTCTYLSF